MLGVTPIARVQEITKHNVSVEQNGFRTDRLCVDQTFNMRMIFEKLFAKDVYAAFMDLEKAYDNRNSEAVWDELKVYGVVGRLLERVKTFY